LVNPGNSDQVITLIRGLYIYVWYLFTCVHFIHVSLI